MLHVVPEMGHIVSTWSAVCSEAPHSQFGEGARLHLCMDEWNRPTPVRRRLRRGKPIDTGPGHKSTGGSTFTTPRSIYDLSIRGRSQVWQDCPREGTNGRLVSHWPVSEDPFNRPSKYDRGKEQRRVSLPVAKLSCWMPESIGRWSVGVGRRHPVTMRKAS